MFISIYDVLQARYGWDTEYIDKAPLKMIYNRYIYVCEQNYEKFKIESYKELVQGAFIGWQQDSRGMSFDGYLRALGLDPEEFFRDKDNDNTVDEEKALRRAEEIIARSKGVDDDVVI